MKIEGNQDCYVWNPGPEENETVQWEGHCEDGLGEGYGTLRWRTPGQNQQPVQWLEAVGVLQEGLPYGIWDLSYQDGLRLEVEYLDGGRPYRSRAPRR